MFSNLFKIEGKYCGNCPARNCESEYGDSCDIFDKRLEPDWKVEGLPNLRLAECKFKQVELRAE